MFGHRWWLPSAMLVCVPGTLLHAQEWTEQDVLARFESQSPQAREIKARVAAVEAFGRTRTVYPNPSATYSREGAGYNSFFEGSQTLPVNGRMRYLREAGSAAVAGGAARSSCWARNQ